jgi:MinD-like ATPase involved in chromosome partitioning or flagellar assembly
MGHVIAFVPASGGTGSTTLAAAVGVRAAAAGRSAVVVDLDRLAGRLDVVLGIEQEDGWRWPDLADVAGVVDGWRLLRQLPSARGAAVLSFGAAPTPGDQPAGSGPGRGGGPVRGGDPGTGSGPGRTSDPGTAETSYRLEELDDWLERAFDVVAGLRAAADVVVLDCPRDERVLAALADEVDVVVLTVGTEVAQVAAAAAAVPLVRVVLDRVRLRPGALSSGPGVPPIEPWVVLRGQRVDELLHDLLMDHLDVPVLGAVGDDRHVLADLGAGRPPGAGGRGPVVDMADRLLLRLVSQLDVA